MLSRVHLAIHARIQIFSSGGGGGGAGQSNKKKSPDNVFLSSAYFTEVKWLISKKTFIFQGSRGGPTYSRGWVQLFPGGPIAYSL